MLKKLAVAAALFFVTVSSNVYALGLGAIDMRSVLNQPMNAVVDLNSASGTDLSQVKVSVASREAHNRAGLTRSPLLADFNFSVEQDDRGNAFIRITSTDTVHEPFIEFLLELQWPNGHLVREYTVLVDPPVTMQARAPVPATPVSRAPAPAVSRPVRQSRPAPIQAAPSPVRTAGARPPSADTYGKVRRNETLWSIANQVRPGSDISIEQMMQALLRENPHAFMNNNINELKAGVTLSIPDRSTIAAITASDARAETNRQAREWKAGQDAPAEVAVRQPEQEELAEADVQGTESAVQTESRLQLTAPEEEAGEGAATASSGDPQAADGESSAELNNQLAMAAEEAEASKAESQELTTRVMELEEQIETMKRLLELKDDALADLQQQASPETVAEVVATAEIETSETTDEIEILDSDGQPVEEMAEEIIVEDEAVDAAVLAAEPRGIVNKLKDNPLLAGLGVLVALLLGGFVWSSVRQKGDQGIFNEEMTLEKHMATDVAMRSEHRAPVVDFDEQVPAEEVVPAQGVDESDPVTEADVYLAYGRIQQAEDVLQAALEKAPDNAELRLKLLEVYHSGGNVSAFDREASDFRDTVAEDDSEWLRVATMGFALSPDNDLYRAGGVGQEKPDELSFDMDLSGMEDPVAGNDVTSQTDSQTDDELALDVPESMEFSLEDVEAVIDDEEDASEGLLDNTDEIATKLDLARAYKDMGDPEGARSILGEVLDEGNDEQKREAEDLITQLG